MTLTTVLIITILLMLIVVSYMQYTQRSDLDSIVEAHNNFVIKYNNTVKIIDNDLVWRSEVEGLEVIEEVTH